jgi:hypothetical protein
MGHLLKIKYVDSRVNVHILASARVPFTLMTLQVPNLALTYTNRITVRDIGTEKGRRIRLKYAATERQTAKDRRVVRGGSECLLCTEKRKGALGKASLYLTFKKG